METFFISDLHLGHFNIIKFCDRPFDDLVSMHDTICNNWANTVGAQDLVYIVGDVAFNPKYIPLLKDLPGRKRLILGNHDTFDIGIYQKIFERIYGVKYLEETNAGRVVLTHIAIHPQNMGDYGHVFCNIHGHNHTWNIRDDRYFNVSVEQINYTPISMDEVIKVINERRGIEA